MRPSAYLRAFLVVLAVLAACIAGTGDAQAPQDAPSYSQDELDQLLAPIALYPDDLLTQILVAATYPLEVIEAARFVEKNPQLTGAALDDAVARSNWDPSVQSLAAFPQVLAMMNDKLEWMERLGNAFLADAARVMDTVQSLRRRAQAVGNLGPMPQQTVVDRDNVIVIEPARPDVVYVPVYDPFTIYGPWWAPGYPPWFWYPPAIYGYPVVFTGIAFGMGWAIGSDHWGWGHADWHHHHVVMNTGHNRFWDRPNRPHPPPGQTWEHAPFHRRGVPYADAPTRQRFQPVSPDAVRQRQNYRGYAPPAQGGVGAPARVEPPRGRAVPPATSSPPSGAANQASGGPATVQHQSPAKLPEAPVVRQSQPSASPPQAPIARQSPPQIARPEAPQPPAYGAQRSAPSVFDPGVSRAQAQINAQRGMQSRSSIPSAPAVRPPSAHSSPVPAAPPVRAPSPSARPMPAPAARGR